MKGKRDFISVLGWPQRSVRVGCSGASGSARRVILRLLTGIVTNHNRKYYNIRVSAPSRVQAGGNYEETHIPSQGWECEQNVSAPCTLESNDREPRTHAEAPVQEAAGEGVETCVARSSVSINSAYVVAEGKTDPPPETG